MTKDLQTYEVEDRELGFGASLGNGHTWVETGSDGRIHSVFASDIGEEVVGAVMLRYCSAETRVTQCRGESCQLLGNVPLAKVGPATFSFQPACQARTFDLPGGVAVRETICVPRVEDGTPGDECVVFLKVEMENNSETSRKICVSSFARLAGRRLNPRILGEYDEENRALFAREEGNTDWVRTLAATRQPSAHVLTQDWGQLYDTDVMPRFEGLDEDEGDVIGGLEIQIELGPGETDSLAFILAFTDEGRATAEEKLERLLDVDEIMERARDYYAEELSRCRLLTPDPVINDGAHWAKVNLLRVLAHYPQGEAFTNEPGVSSNVVARDVIWFVYGCDHYRPESSRALLEALAEVQYENGMMPEYYNAVTGEVDDYDLNINDGTPLYVLGVNHHARSTGDMEWLEKTYDSVRCASDYILSQRDERGLVFCEADGMEVWGIASWRNVIPNYQINGAVTEINAECAAALRAMGHMAENIGRDEDGKYYTEAAQELTNALNEHLLDPDRQLYLLNIDTEGREHTDVTADELFPVLFRVAEEDVAYRIIRRLKSPDFWTPGGLRTVSREGPLYDPAKFVGLLGGVWPGVTWWYAFAAARYHPELMVEALHSSYEHYNRNPRLYNTVPGQFSEWFDGESLVNRGMRLSPWEPPRFLWAGIEGVAGIMLSPGPPGINPLIPPDWEWTAATRVCYHDGEVSFFAARMGEQLHLFANTEFKGDLPRDVFREDVTALVSAEHDDIHALGFRNEERILVALGSSRESPLSAPVDISAVVDADKKYVLRQYSSERGAWDAGNPGSGRSLSKLAAHIEGRGFHLMELAKK
ncbi:MAG: hypothetical protein KGZ25_00165 [Planctomycetes bacterium]|nr:hypothetical protein [Planctomycetota bacterium]